MSIHNNNIMEDLLINYDTAVLAKEKGFNWKCYSMFHNKTLNVNDGHCDYNQPNHKFFIKENIISAPTQSLLQKWLREIHHIYVTALPTYTGSAEIKRCFFEISFKNKTMQFSDMYGYFDTYELALETGLQEELNLI